MTCAFVNFIEWNGCAFGGTSAYDDEWYNLEPVTWAARRAYCQWDPHTNSAYHVAATIMLCYGLLTCATVLARFFLAGVRAIAEESGRPTGWYHWYHAESDSSKSGL